MRRQSLPRLLYLAIFKEGLPCWLSGKEFACQCKRLRFDPWVGKIPSRRKWQPYSSILAWKIPWTEVPTVHRVTESWTGLNTAPPPHTHTFKERGFYFSFERMSMHWKMLL